LAVGLDHVSDADFFAEAAARLSRAKTPGDWIDAYMAGEAITAGDAAQICGVSADTIRRRADKCTDIGEPIGILVVGVWLLSLQRVLNELGRRKGHAARAAAAERAKQLLEMRSSSDNLLPWLHAESAGRAKAEK